MKGNHWFALLFVALGLAVSCEDSSSSNNGPPSITYTLEANCAGIYPNGVQITFDGEVIGTVMAGGELEHNTTTGDHTWNAKTFGTHTINVPKNGVVQPLICGN